MSKKVEQDDPPSTSYPFNCEICGGPASGYHYEVPSCGGCKTFFRRTIIKQFTYTCLATGRCEKVPGRRGGCRSCRLDRCIRAGMNPLLILSEKKPSENKVVVNILRKRNLEITDQPESDSPVSERLPILIKPISFECMIDSLIQSRLHIESAYYRLRGSPAFAAKPTMDDRLDNVIQGFSKLCIDYPELPSPSPPPPTFASDGELDKDCPHNVNNWVKIWPFADLMASIEYLKSFPFFQSLGPSDKKVIVRNAGLMCSQLNLSFFSYEKGSDLTVHPDGTLPHGGIIPEFLVDAHCTNIEIIKRLNLDKVEYVLLKAILASNCAIEDLSLECRKMLQEEQEKYSKSLISYCLARRGIKEGPSAYVGIIAMTDFLCHLTRKRKDVYLLRKALDIKHDNPLCCALIDDVFEC